MNIGCVYLFTLVFLFLSSKHPGVKFLYHMAVLLLVLWRTSIHFSMVNAPIYNPTGGAWRFLKRLKIELPYDPAIPLLSIHPKKIKTLIRKDICTPIFIAALFIIAKVWKQPKCPSTDEWIKKMWDTNTHTHTHTKRHTHTQNGILYHHSHHKHCIPEGP